MKAVKQYAPLLFPPPSFIGPCMGLNIPKTGLCHLSEFMTGGGVEYTAAIGLKFIVRGGAYLCAGGSWTQLSIGLLNHGKRARTPTYLRLIGMAVCGDKNMAALATIRGDDLQEIGHFVVH